MADKRKRDLATVVYPDSAPEDWQQILSDYHIPCFVSPLHDMDINPDGSPKKPHYHVMVCFDGKHSDEQFDEIFNAIGGVGREQILSKRGYARYLCHLDNPEKHQYGIWDVLSYGGADYIQVIGEIAKYQCIHDMMQFCNENGVIAFSDLLEYARQNNWSWFRCLCDSSAYVMEKYIKSRYWKISEVEKAKGKE